jgi:outer membrane protein assembly factor BamB
VTPAGQAYRRRRPSERRYASAMTILAMCVVVSCANGGDSSARSTPSSALGTALTVTVTSEAAPSVGSSTSGSVTSEPSGSVTSEPAAGPRAPSLSSDPAVAAINLENATTRWTMQRSDDLFGVSEVIADDGLVFVRSGYCQNSVAAALEPTSGAVVWRTGPDLPIDEGARVAGVPGLVANGIIIMSTSQRVVGLDTATGQPRWTSQDVGRLVAESQSVVVVWSPVAGLVLVLDRVTGAERWSLRTNQPLQTPPPGPANAADLPPFVSAAADEERVYIRFESEVMAYQALDGNQQWATPVGPWDPAVLLRVLDVLLTESDGGVVALDAADGSQRWSVPNNTDAEQLALTDARMADGNLYLSLGLSVTAFDLATGTQRWQSPPEPLGLLLAAGGGRVLLAVGGRLHLLDAAAGTELSNNTASAVPQGNVGPAIYEIDRDNLYLGWSCGGG